MPSGNLTLSKNKRLWSSAEFARVRAEGQMHRGGLVAIGVTTDTATPGFRAGFITSRKVGNATRRNRVRRRLREIVRKNQTALRQNVWIVTIARAAAANATYHALEDEWLRLAKRASILARS